MYPRSVHLQVFLVADMGVLNVLKEIVDFDIICEIVFESFTHVWHRDNYIWGDIEDTEGII